MIGLFSLSLFITAFYSDFFQAPSELSPEINRFRSLFQPGQILGVREVILKNNLGTFHFQKSATDPDTPWTMISPRKLPANSSLVRSILKDLNEVKIRSVHENDTINIANYSLDSVSLEVSLIDSNDKTTSVKFGLVNPLDNSTYVSLSDQNAIYHIDNISTSLNSLDLSSFVDTRIFTFDLSQIDSVTIFKGNAEDNRPQFSAELKKNTWVGKNSYILKPEAFKEFVGELADLRSPLILDKVDEELLKEVNVYLDKPSYEIVVTDKAKHTYKYKITGLVKSLSGLKLEKWQHFIIKPSNREFPYILGKKHMRLFTRNERHLRSGSLFRD